MSQPNTIGNTAASFADGSVVVYTDTDPSHIRQQRFQSILDRKPLTFQVQTVNGDTFGVDLVAGSFTVGDDTYVPNTPPTTPLRLVYYKHMESSVDGMTPIAECVYFVVGWQTTEDGKNKKCGVKVFPKNSSFIITEDI